MALRSAPVSTFLTETLADETGAPVGSETIPVTLDEACAWAEGASIIKIMSASTRKRPRSTGQLPAKRNNELIGYLGKGVINQDPDSWSKTTIPYVSGRYVNSA